MGYIPIARVDAAFTLWQYAVDVKLNRHYFQQENNSKLRQHWCKVPPTVPADKLMLNENGCSHMSVHLFITSPQQTKY